MGKTYCLHLGGVVPYLYWEYPEKRSVDILRSRGAAARFSASDRQILLGAIPLFVFTSVVFRHTQRSEYRTLNNQGHLVRST